jgi:ABC-type lipoprotein release transport system permease subunit
MASAFGLARLLAGLLFGVTPHDGVVFATVPSVLSVVALVAAWLPARRATRVDVVRALHSE